MLDFAITRRAEVSHLKVQSFSLIDLATSQTAVPTASALRRPVGALVSMWKWNRVENESANENVQRDS